MKTFLNIVATLCIVASFSVSANEAYGSYEDDPTKPFDASNTFYETMKVSWIRVDKNKVHEECNKVRKNYGLNQLTSLADGCTIWHNDECIIVTETMTTMHIVGHEVRHCFQRNWH